MKLKIHSLFILITLLSIPLLNHCAVQQDVNVKTKDGKVYGTVQGAFRHRWWNYYERGLSFAEGQFYEDAVKDLLTAIQQRDKDQRMARTYGMHFIDYFPHRELGICYLLKGKAIDAARELKISLEQYPSSKAYFYLDRVRETLIKASGHPVGPPKLVLQSPLNDTWTRDDPITISGVVTDENYVSAVTVMGAPVFFEGSRKRVLIEKKLDLSQGRHEIEVMAVNLMGKTDRQTIVVHVDRQGPMITIEDIKESPTAPEYVITGSLYDPAGAHVLKINGQPVPLEKGSEAFFSYQIFEHIHSIDLMAEDELGNQTTAQYSLAQSKASRQGIMLAGNGSIAIDLMAVSFFKTKDTEPPSINLKGWTESQTVFMEKIYLEGEITDNTNIANLAINQKPILRREGKSIFFNHLAELNAGKNNIQVKAEDSAGNISEKQIDIMMEVPKALQLEERLRTTVMPFEQKGTLSDASLSFQENLTGALVNQNRFQLIEREKLDYVLQEQKLSRTDLIDKNTAIRLGKLMASQSIITGSIIETQTGLEIVARMIDTETSQLLASKDVYGEEKSLPGLKTLSEGLAVKFHQEFPLIDGLVVQKKGKLIFTDIGQDKTKLARRFIVYREEPIKHPVTGKILGTDNTIIGRARVTQVMPDLSKAEVVEGEAKEIKPLDKVITE
jgi:TolB-like protein